MKICRTATVPFMLHNHLRLQITATIAAGHDVTLVCSNGPEVAHLRAIPGVKIYLLEIARVISPVRDCIALFRLVQYFLREEFDVVHSTTPKGGLISMLASWLTRVPVRMHTFTGQPWIELHGIKRVVVRLGDFVTARLSTMNYTDSQSQLDFLINNGIADGCKLKILGSGSLAGVDLTRFDANRFAPQKLLLRHSLQIASDTKVIVFVGRLTRDKGICELVESFVQLRTEGHLCFLLLVGPLENDRDSIPTVTLNQIKNRADIYWAGYSYEPEKYLAISDILCLPSYREGFGTVILEAAAMGIPAVGTDIIGIQDAIVNGYTGILVAVKNEESLARGIKKLLDTDGLCQTLGSNAFHRVVEEFDANKVNLTVIEEYEIAWKSANRRNAKKII